jgi:hypothetical protein
VVVDRNFWPSNCLNTGSPDMVEVFHLSWKQRKIERPLVTEPDIPFFEIFLQEFV